MTENNAAKQLIEKAKNRLNKFYNPALYKAPKKRELTDEEKIRQSLGEKIDDSAPVEYIAGTTQTVLAQQEPYGKAPETMTGTYQGKGQKSNSVIALLDMMVADIAKEMTESKVGEEQAQKDYEEFMAESKKNRAANQKSTNEATTGLANTNTRLAELADKKASTETLLSENAQRTANLHTSCDFLINNFDVRKEARAAEVEGLKNAKAILSGANFS